MDITQAWIHYCAKRRATTSTCVLVNILRDEASITRNTADLKAGLKVTRIVRRALSCTVQVTFHQSLDQPVRYLNQQQPVKVVG